LTTEEARAFLVLGRAWRWEVDEQRRNCHERLCDCIACFCQFLSRRLACKSFTSEDEGERNAGACDALDDEVVGHNSGIRLMQGFVYEIWQKTKRCASAMEGTG
jgi:hypothetical protein